MLFFFLGCSERYESPLIDRFECSSEPFDPGKGDGCELITFCCVEPAEADLLCWYELESGEQYPCDHEPELDCDTAFKMAEEVSCSQITAEDLD